MSALLTATAPWIADAVFHDPRFTRYLRILFVGFGFNMVAEFGMSYLAVRQRSALYSTITVTKFVAGALLNVLFLVGLRLGVEGILISNLITNAALGTWLLVRVVRENGTAFDPPLLRRMVASVIPWCWCRWPASDQLRGSLFPPAYAGFAQVGIYALAYSRHHAEHAGGASFSSLERESFEVAATGRGRFYTRVFTWFAAALGGMARDVARDPRRDARWLPVYARLPCSFPSSSRPMSGTGSGRIRAGAQAGEQAPLLGAIFAGPASSPRPLLDPDPRYGMFGAVAATFLAFLARPSGSIAESARLPPSTTSSPPHEGGLLALGFWIARVLLAALPHLASFSWRRALPRLRRGALGVWLGAPRREGRADRVAQSRARAASTGRSSGGQVKALVSVVTPTFNRKHVLRRALDSIYAQTVPEVEAIVVDDGSTTGRSHDRGVPRPVVYVKHGKAGPPPPKTAGQRASGAFIAFPRPDDVFYPGSEASPRPWSAPPRRGGTSERGV